METRSILIFFHLIGYAMLFTTAIAGWMLNRQYMRSADLQTKASILKAMRPIGLMSPIAILIMVISGIGNMHLRALGIFTEGWLTAKILLFTIAAVTGIVYGIRSRKRGSMVGQMAAGNAPEGTLARVKSLDGQFSIFYLVQTLILFGILILSILKPGRYV